MGQPFRKRRACRLLAAPARVKCCYLTWRDSFVGHQTSICEGVWFGRSGSILNSSSAERRVVGPTEEIKAFLARTDERRQRTQLYRRFPVLSAGICYLRPNLGE